MDEEMEYDDVENDEDPLPDVVEVSDSEPEVEPPEEPPEPPEEAQEETSNDGEEIAAKREKLETEEEPKAKQVENDSDDTGEQCPICMDTWSNAGEHRLCSLRCGHLFGHSCVLKWLQIACTASTRRCPQCNRKAAVRDIRILYARKISVVDTAELERLKKQLDDVTTEKKRLEIEMTKCNLQRKIYEQELSSMRSQMLELERQQSEMSLRLNESRASRCSEGKKFHLEKTLSICRESNCRVLDHNMWNRCLAISQKSENPLYPGYGVIKINAETFQTMQFIMLHTQTIRDLAFHPNHRTLMMSVGFDRTVKILDIHNNIVVHGYPTASQLWSCCWSADNENTLLVGGQNGTITEFDVRQTSGALGVHASPGDPAPVASLAAVPRNSSAGIPRGGFVAAQLKTCYAYELKDVGTWTTRLMNFEGPFVSVRYDAKNHHALLSTRSNPRVPYARHMVFTIEKGNDESLDCNVVHTFNSGQSPVASRPCHVNLEDDTLVAIYQASTKSIPLWSVSSGDQIHSLAVDEPVLDMCAFGANDSTHLAALSGNRVRIYKYE